MAMASLSNSPPIERIICAGITAMMPTVITEANVLLETSYAMSPQKRHAEDANQHGIMQQMSLILIGSKPISKGTGGMNLEPKNVLKMTRDDFVKPTKYTGSETLKLPICF